MPLSESMREVILIQLGDESQQALDDDLTASQAYLDGRYHVAATLWERAASAYRDPLMKAEARDSARMARRAAYQRR